MDIELYRTVWAGCWSIFNYIALGSISVIHICCAFIILKTTLKIMYRVDSNKVQALKDFVARKKGE